MKKTVLIGEDNALNLKLMRELLEAKKTSPHRMQLMERERLS